MANPSRSRLLPRRPIDPRHGLSMNLILWWVLRFQQRLACRSREHRLQSRKYRPRSLERPPKEEECKQSPANKVQNPPTT